MGAQAWLVAANRELPLASPSCVRGAHTTVVYTCFTMALVFEDCVTVLRSEASVGTGSLLLHFVEYYPKVGYTIGDVLKMMMNKYFTLKQMTEPNGPGRLVEDQPADC